MRWIDKCINVYDTHFDTLSFIYYAMAHSRPLWFGFEDDMNGNTDDKELDTSLPYPIGTS